MTREEQLKRLDALVADRIALDLIAVELSGREWTPSTLDNIASLVRETGRKVEEVRRSA